MGYRNTYIIGIKEFNTILYLVINIFSHKKSKMAAGGHLGNTKMTISLQLYGML